MVLPPPRPHPLWRALAVVVAIEVGLVLLTLPWTPFWEHNYWITRAIGAHPALTAVLLSPYIRGALSGLGLINLWIAASEITPFRP